MSSDMREFDPFISNEHSKDDDLQYAYDQVLNAMESGGSSLDYWRRAIEDQQDSTHLLTPISSNSSAYTESDSDDEYLKEAKRLSLAEHRSRNNTELPTSSPAPLGRLAQTTKVPMPSYTRAPGDLRNHFHPVVKRNSIQSSERVPKPPQIEESDVVEGNMYADLSWRVEMSLTSVWQIGKQRIRHFHSRKGKRTLFHPPSRSSKTTIPVER